MDNNKSQWNNYKIFVKDSSFGIDLAARDDRSGTDSPAIEAVFIKIYYST